MLQLITLLLTFVSALIRYANDRRLIETGEAKEAQRALEETNERVKRALDARNLVLRSSDDRLRDNDGYRRD